MGGMGAQESLPVEECLNQRLMDRKGLPMGGSGRNNFWVRNSKRGSPKNKFSKSQDQWDQRGGSEGEETRLRR